VFRWESGERLEEGIAKLKEPLAGAVPNPVSARKCPL
jgi:hypothetical protein